MKFLDNLTKSCLLSSVNLGDNIVDFLDASAAQNVRRSKPNTITKANSNNPAMKKGNEFEIAPDGRFIIKGKR